MRDTGSRMQEAGRSGWRVRVLLALVPLASLVAQPSAAQTRTVEILNADFVEVTTDSAGTVRRLEGDVRLRQDTTLLRARQATYYESRGEVVLSGDVRIISGRDTLTASVAEYDSNAKTAEARGSVRVGDGESVLRAPFVSYDSRAEVSAFEGGGEIAHRGALLTAPSGTYSSARRVAQLDGPVTLADSAGVLTAARGTYDARVRRADFAGEVRIRRPDAAVDADSVVYFRRTERARAYGRVVLERIGADAVPEGRAASAPADSSRRSFLFGELLLYDGQRETASVRGDDRLDPLLVTLRTDSAGVDTTLVRAPRIDAERIVAGADTSTVLVAAGGARLWERRLSALADSARFVRQPDAAGVPLDRLALAGGRPSVWADGAQITGDSLFARSRDGTLDSLSVIGAAFAARLDSTLGRLQQIAGRQMRATFDGEALRRLAVWPNAQALYFRATDEGLLGGADEVSADSLSFQFEDGELREIGGYRGIVGTAYGPQAVPETRLPGFAYAPQGGPTKAEILGEGWEVGWLERYGPAPASGSDAGPGAEDGAAPPDAGSSGD